MAIPQQTVSRQDLDKALQRTVTRQDLDEALQRHPAVSAFIQFSGRRGKRGTRSTVGGIFRTQRHLDTADLNLFVTQATVSRAAGRRPVFQGEVAVPRMFKMPLFRRALHHVAFNEFTRCVGSRAALSQEFNAIRKYVRSPDKREIWTFAELFDDRSTSGEIAVNWPYQECRRLVRISLGYCAFVVSLSRIEPLAPRDLLPSAVLNDASVKAPSRFRLTYIASDEEPVQSGT